MLLLLGRRVICFFISGLGMTLNYNRWWDFSSRVVQFWGNWNVLYLLLLPDLLWPKWDDWQGSSYGSNSHFERTAWALQSCKAISPGMWNRYAGGEYFFTLAAPAAESRHNVLARGGHGSGVSPAGFCVFLSDLDQESLVIFGSNRSPHGLYTNVISLSENILIFGCIDGSRSLNRSRIHKC